MAHRILGLDIGAHRVKGTLIETSWRNFEVLQVAEVRVDPAAEPPVAPATEPEPDFPTPDAADAETAEDTDSDAAARPEDADEDEESPEAPPPGFVSAVRKLVNRPGMEFDEVVCAISGHWVSTRIVQLPFTSRKKIDSVLGPQVEDEVPFDMDEMILAYEILDASKEGSTILAALAKREDVRRFLHWVEAAGLDPKVLSMTSSALAVAAVSAHPTRIGGYAVLDIGADSTDIVVVNGARVVQVRTIPTGGTHVTAELARLASLDMDKASRLKEEVGKILGDADAVADERVTRLSDTLIAAHQNLLGRLRQTIRSCETDGGFKVGTLMLTGHGARLPGLDRYLGEALDVRVEPFQAFTEAIPGQVEGTPETNDTYAVSLGLALSGFSGAKLQGVNFRVGEFAYHKLTEAVQGSLRGAAIMGGILLALFIILVWQKNSVRSDRVEALEAQARKLYLDTFKQSPPAGGSLLNSFQTQMSQVEGKYKVVGYLGDGDLRALDVIKALSEAIDKETKIDIKKMELKQDFVKIEALTDTYETVAKIENQLQAHPAFVRVNREDAKKAASDEIKFKLTVFLVEQQDKQSGVTTLFKPGQTGGVAP